MVKSQTEEHFHSTLLTDIYQMRWTHGGIKGLAEQTTATPLSVKFLYRFLIILSKIYGNYVAGKCLSCPFLNFLDPPLGPRLSFDDIIANTTENIHVITMAFLSLRHCHLSYKCPQWVGVRRDSCICRLVPSLQNSSFQCHHAMFLPTNGC